MRNGMLLRETRDYRKDQVSSSQKIHLLWRNLAESIGVVEVDKGHPGAVHVEIVDGLFDDTVRVTFAAYVRRT